MDVFIGMAYYIDLFSPETYFAYSNSERSISGFRERQRGIASSIKPGDKLICYMTKLSRWVGVLEVTSSFFVDDSPIFIHPVDPYLLEVFIFHKDSAQKEPSLDWNGSRKP